MFGIDDPTAVAVLPTPEAAGTVGFWTEGNPGTGTPATLMKASFFNGLQQELLNILTAAGVTPSKTTYNQIVTALNTLYKPGRLLRTTVFLRVAGVQNVIVDGAAPTTTGASTFTPLSTMAFIDVEVQGAGSGGAGASGAGASTVSVGSPGCSGSYARARHTAATVGASQAITVGAKSAGGSGAAGGTSSIGSLTTAPGGSAAGGLNNQSPPVLNGTGSAAGSPTGANLVSIVGGAPSVSFAFNTSTGIGGAGGGSVFGNGAAGAVLNTNGTNAVNYGSGGSGTVVNQAGGSATGGNGADGIIIIREYA